MDASTIFSGGQMKLLRFFIDHPYKEFYLRELSRTVGLSGSAVKKYCDSLVKDGIILDYRRGNLRIFKANTENKLFQGIKSALNADNIIKCDLMRYLQEHVVNLSSVTLFGSMAQGLNDEKSDIDLLIIGSNNPTIPKKYEEKLDAEINAHFYSWSKWQEKAKKDKAFYNEVISKGINLYGDKPVIS